MDILNIIKEKASEVALGAAKASNSAVKQIKSNINLADKKQELDKVLIELGRAVYEAQKSGESISEEEITSKCDCIKSIEDEIASIKEAVKEAKNIKNCPSCGKDIDASSKFCPVCGEKLD